MSSEFENENLNVAEEAEKPAVNPNMKWYVIHTYSGYENKVKDSIDRMIANGSTRGLISRVVIPVDEEVSVDEKGKEKIELKRRFPGYVLVEMVHDRDSWYWVRNVRGVTGFVGPDPTEPTPLTLDEVRALRIDLDEAIEQEFVAGIQKGDRINIIAGPLAGNEGIVVEIPKNKEELREKGCIKAIVSMFGRDMTAELEYSQVEKAD